MSNSESNAAYLGNIQSLVTFEPALSKQERVDIQDVLLDAQLFAGAKFNFETQWSSWMHYYRNRLTSRGVKQRSVVTDDSLLLNNASELLSATFAIKGISDHDVVGDLVRRSFEEMGIYQVSDAYFRYGSNSTYVGSFQFVPCLRTENDQVVMSLCSLHLVSDPQSTGGRRLLFFFKGGSYVFDRQDYAAHRSDVERYLAGRSRSMIRAVEI